MLESEHAAKKYYEGRIHRNDLSEREIIGIINDPHHITKITMLRVLRDNQLVSKNIAQVIQDLLGEERSPAMRREMWKCLENHMTAELEIKLLLEQSEAGINNNVNANIIESYDQSMRWLVRGMRLLLKEKLHKLSGNTEDSDFIFDE